jgi:two-component system response regulator NreC
MPLLRVLVVDDHAVMRRVICGLLSRNLTLEVVCETADGEEAISKAQELQPDIVLLDISLPGISGIGAASEILRVSPKSQIIFVSEHTSLQVVREALEAGGRGYVAKCDAGLELSEAIRIVSGGKPFVSRGIRKQGWASQEMGFVN